VEHTPDPKFRVKILWHHNRWKQPPSACICFRWLLIFHHGKSQSNQHLEKIVFTFSSILSKSKKRIQKKLILNQFLQPFIFIGFPEDKIDIFSGWWHALWCENTEIWGRWSHFDHCSRNTYECSSILTLYSLTVAVWSLFISCFGFGELISSCKRADTRLLMFEVPQWSLVAQEIYNRSPTKRM